MTKKETIYQLEAVRDSCRAHGDNFNADVLNHCIDSVKTFREAKADSCERQPLTMAELRKMDGETVYCLELNAEVTVRSKRYNFVEIYYKFPGLTGTHTAHGLTLYRNTPEDARAWTKEDEKQWRL